jgi:hypothetical protein
VDDDQPTDQPQPPTPGQIDRAAREDSEPAHILQDGIPYVRGWAQAVRATTALEKALNACGLGDAMPYLRADVNAFGVGAVEMGRITPETAYAIAALLSQARAIPGNTRHDTEQGSAA